MKFSTYVPKFSFRVFSRNLVIPEPERIKQKTCSKTVGIEKGVIGFPNQARLAMTICSKVGNRFCKGKNEDDDPWIVEKKGELICE